MTNIPEVEERIHENELADGPSNPVAQHVYDGFPKRQSTSGPSLVLGAAAIGLVLVLASIFGLWLVRSVRRLNREVTHLNRQTEQLNQRVQGAEQHVKSLDQRASQAAAAQAAPAQAATIRPEQVPGQVKQPEATSAAQAQSPLEPEAAAQPPTQAAHKTEENRTQHADELQKLKQSLGQIAETRRTADGVVMTLGEKSLRFDSGKSAIAPQYRAILNRVAGVLTPLKGYSIYVYGYTDDVGTKDYNLKLSGRRAEAVRDSLIQAGIKQGVITTKGFGKSDPRAKGDSPQARSANRRVEIGIVDSRILMEPVPQR